ncbi:MAG: hypothetical protein AB7I19_11720 [Planctomycetota bacterium]
MKCAAVLVGLAILSSCMWVPDSGMQPRDRGLVPVDVRASFTPGELTRADLLCLLGEPDWISADEQRLAYRVQRLDSYFWAYLIAGMAVVHFGVIETELFWFDAAGRLARHEQVVSSDVPNGGDGGPGALVFASEIDDAAMEALFVDAAK